MAQWEYATFVAIRSNDDVVVNINGVMQDIRSKRRASRDVLNDMGAEGWELVTILTDRPASPDVSEESGGIYRYYLKRQR